MSPLLSESCRGGIHPLYVAILLFKLLVNFGPYTPKRFLMLNEITDLIQTKWLKLIVS